jgi:hypothetical protein
MTPGRAFESGRMEVAWTVSANAACGRHGFATAVLRVECDWAASPSGAPAAARATASVIVAAQTRAVALAAPVAARVERADGWVHVELLAAGVPAVRASFERGRLAYCTGTVVAMAGLAGGTYDAPTAILECYEAGPSAAQAAQAAGPAVPGP